MLNSVLLGTVPLHCGDVLLKIPDESQAEICDCRVNEAGMPRQTRIYLPNMSDKILGDEKRSDISYIFRDEITRGTSFGADDIFARFPEAR